MSNEIKYPDDKIIENNLNRIKDRADIGLTKYGVSMEYNDGDIVYWLDHAIEEALDLANYLERIKQKWLTLKN